MNIRAEENAATEDRISRLEGAHEHLATKADVAEVRTAIAESESRTTQRIADLRTENEEQRNRSLEERVSYLEDAHKYLATKADVAEVRTAIAEFETRIAQRIADLRTENEEQRNRRLEERVAYLEGIVFEHTTTKASPESVLSETQSTQLDFQDEVKCVPTEKRNRADIINMIVQIVNIGVGLLKLGFDLLRFIGVGG